MSVKHCCNYTKVRYECINGYKLIEGDRTHHCKDGILYGKQPRCGFPKGKLHDKKLSDIDPDNSCFLAMNVFIVNTFLIIITITTFIFLQITMTIIIIHHRLQQLLSYIASAIRCIISSHIIILGGKE